MLAVLQKVMRTSLSCETVRRGETCTLVFSLVLGLLGSMNRSVIGMLVGIEW